MTKINWNLINKIPKMSLILFSMILSIDYFVNKLIGIQLLKLSKKSPLQY